MICSGTSKKTGRPCRSHARRGKTLCNVCELKSAEPGKHRGYARSAFLPAGTLERCQYLLNQPDIYDLTAEIVVIQALFTQLQEMLEAGDPVDRWKRVQKLVKTLHGHWRSESDFAVIASNEAMTDLLILVEQCAIDREVRKELKGTALILATLQEKQAKMENLHAELVPMNKMRMLFTAMLQSIYEGVPDDLTGMTGMELRGNLAGSIRRMFNRPEIPERAQRRNAELDALEADYKMLDGGENTIVFTDSIRPVDDAHFDVDSKEVSETDEMDILAMFEPESTNNVLQDENG